MASRNKYLSFKTGRNALRKIQIPIRLVAILFVAIVGSALLISSRAASPSVAIEVESGNMSNNVSLRSDSNANGGSAVVFAGVVSGTHIAPTQPYPTSEVGASTGTHTSWTGTYTFDDTAAATLPQEDFTITHPLSGQSATLPVRVLRGKTFTDALRFQLTNTTVLMDDCVISPSGSGYHAVYIEYGPNDAWITDDVMKPRVIFNHCTWTSATKDWVNGVLGHSYWVLHSSSDSFENAFDVGGMSVFYHNTIRGGTARTEAHTDGIQFYGGTNVSIVENWIDVEDAMGETGAINFSTDFAVVGNSSIIANTLKGGTYTLYLDRTGPYELQDVTVKDNRWYDDSAMYGPVVNDNTTNLIWSGNKYLLSGATVNY